MLDRIPVKSADEIELMREACLVTATVLDEVGDIVKPGISTEEINSFVHRRTSELGATPSPLNYKGFPKSVCVSPNDVICHGIPAPFTILQSGDIVNIDVTSFKNGFHGDSSRMYFVGGELACSELARDLVRITRESLMAGINEVRPGKKVGDIGAAIQEYIRNNRKEFGIVREYTGHGVGRQFHEPPQVLHVGRRGTGEILRAGMTFTIEPMINAGSHKTSLSKVDGWTVRTADGSLSAQWEHTILVTDTGHELMTKSPKGLF